VATRRVIDPENARAGARWPARHCAVLVDLSAASTVDSVVTACGPQEAWVHVAVTAPDCRGSQLVSAAGTLPFVLVLALGCPGLE
jgi:hypothetical protein